jgi:hypothetical protein
VILCCEELQLHGPALWWLPASQKERLGGQQHHHSCTSNASGILQLQTGGPGQMAQKRCCNRRSRFAMLLMHHAAGDWLLYRTRLCFITKVLARTRDHEAHCMFADTA